MSNFTLVTSEDLDSDLIIPEYPLPPQVFKLSAIHKSDYLRAYLGHFWGGGYLDVKPIPREFRREYGEKWSSVFDELNSGYIAHGEANKSSTRHRIQFSGRPGGATNCGCDIGVTFVYLSKLDHQIAAASAKNRQDKTLGGKEDATYLSGLQKEKQLFISWASRYGPPASDVDWSHKGFDRWNGYHFGSDFGLCRIMRCLNNLIGGITNFVVQPRSGLTELWLAHANWKLDILGEQLARASAVNPDITKLRCGAEYFNCDVDAMYLNDNVSNLSNVQHCLLSDWSLIRGDPYPYYKSRSAYPITWNGIGSSLLCPVQVLFLGEIQTGPVPPFHAPNAN